MNKLACRYAVIQFMPYPEIGEFANVGIVLLCPKTGFFNFELCTDSYKRITNFFDRLEKKIYLAAIKEFEKELDRLKKEVLVINNTIANANEKLIQDFELYTHPREAIIRFGQQGGVLTDDPAKVIRELYDFYVKRNFTKEEGYEEVLKERIKNIITEAKPKIPFRVVRIGNNEFHTQFPFVQTINNTPVKIIKPLYLAYDDSNQIYNHGDTWITKIKRLRQRNYLPEGNVLFTVAPPETNTEALFKAYNEICNELVNQEIKISNVSDQKKIFEFINQI